MKRATLGWCAAALVSLAGCGSDGDDTPGSGGNAGAPGSGGSSGSGAAATGGASGSGGVAGSGGAGTAGSGGATAGVDGCAVRCAAAAMLMCESDDLASCSSACEAERASAQQACPLESEAFETCLGTTETGDYQCDEFGETALRGGLCVAEEDELLRCLGN